jgi:hypothetical protein
MLGPNKRVFLALLCLWLCYAAPASAQRTAPTRDDRGPKAVALVELNNLRVERVQERLALRALIARQTALRDRFRSLANRPYTACPHHRTFEDCTHTELKEKYLRDKQAYQAQAAKAEAALADLQKKLGAVESDLATLQTRIDALAADLGVSGAPPGPAARGPKK